jgi:hypothetical protein
MRTEFVLRLPLFSCYAFVQQVGTIFLSEVPLLLTTSLTIHISRLCCGMCDFQSQFGLFLSPYLVHP